MKVPFTIEQFLQVIKDYNLSVWPMQYIFYFIGILAMYFSFRKSTYSDKLINISLALLWLWTGIVYHLGFFTTINKAAYAFGILTIIQGIIFLYSCMFKTKLSYKFQPDVYGWVGATLILYSLVIYPLIGHYSSHSYPYAPTFGLPCPTTIFTLGMILLIDKRVSLWILAIPLLWSIIGTSAALNFGIREDAGLLISGVTALVLIVYRNRKLNPLSISK